MSDHENPGIIDKTVSAKFTGRTNELFDPKTSTDPLPLNKFGSQTAPENPKEQPLPRTPETAPDTFAKNIGKFLENKNYHVFNGPTDQVGRLAQEGESFRFEYIFAGKNEDERTQEARLLKTKLKDVNTTYGAGRIRLRDNADNTDTSTRDGETRQERSERIFKEAITNTEEPVLYFTVIK